MKGSKTEPVDIFIIGGGVNGCGIARDAAGRGYSVILAEKGDLASGTSQWSSKLFHGGLRYLQYYDFKLVRESLQERERLLAASPHISWPMRFVIPFRQEPELSFKQRVPKLFAELKFILPSHGGINPKWLMRLGLFIYDHLGGRKTLPDTTTLLKNDPTLSILKQQYDSALEYSDCWVDDARLVVLSAVDARNRGAKIKTNSEVLSVKRVDDLWEVRLHNDKKHVYFSRSLVNAGGPWVEKIINEVAQLPSKEHIRLVRGSHIIVKRIHHHDKAYFLQGADGRIVFILPYQNDFNLIGTTDVAHESALEKPECSDEERDYLLAFVNEYLAKPLNEKAVISSFAGVRPLYDDGSGNNTETTRDYVLSLNSDGAPLLNVFGGKITTYRHLAEEAMDKLAAYFPGKGSAWTKDSSLPGGDFAVNEVTILYEQIRDHYPFLTPQLALRFTKSYGTLTFALLDSSNDMEDLGLELGHGLTDKEVRYLIEHEFAATAEDILWRRTKLGLYFNEQQSKDLGRAINAIHASNEHLTDQRKGAGNVS